MIAFPKPAPDMEAAVAAFARGEADAMMQQKILTWIVETLATVGESPMAPGDPQQTSFNAGRQWVGLALLAGAGLRLVALPHLRLREDDDGGR